ncbi:MAG: DUF2851 family protein [Chloroflexota bacterium]|nr:DUF2851 family protein [Chloroflexota bacterium]
MSDQTAPPRLGEAQLSELWRGGRFPVGALVTRDGVPVHVIDQGRAGRGPGPDFRGACISGPSGLPLRGDIELHVRSSSFRAHGHHHDAAYANVILHVVFEDDTGINTPLFGGGVAPVVALAPWVARRAEELQQWLARPLLWREPCHHALIRMGADGVTAALEGEGARRFEARVARARETVAASGLEQALYEGLLEALGYGGNAPQMLALARLLPWAQLRERSDGPGMAEALLLGSAGLLPSQRAHSGPLEPHVQDLEWRFAAARLPSLPAGLWKLWGVRPENAPARRIASAAGLLGRLTQPARLLGVLDATTVNDAVAALTLTARGYWLNHHDLCAAPVRLLAGLIGRSRALEILINAVLPVAAASENGIIAARARALYDRLPRPSAYGVTRFIEGARFARDPDRHECAPLPGAARAPSGLVHAKRLRAVPAELTGCVVSGQRSAANKPRPSTSAPRSCIGSQRRSRAGSLMP